MITNGSMVTDVWSRRMATVGLLIAVLVVSLDGTIAATALPRIAADLHGIAFYVWVTTAYLVTSTVMQPIAGKLSDIFGRRRLIGMSIVGFVGGSVLAGISPSMATLVMFRAVQGVFGGVLITVPFAAVPDLYAVENRVKLQGVFGAVGGVGAIVGPLLGGVITDGLGWRWIFYLNVPIGAMALAIILLHLPKSTRVGRLRELDLLGSAALTAGVAPLLIGLSIGGNGRLGGTATLLIVLGVAIMCLFVWVEYKARRPVVPLSLFKDRTFTVGIVIAAFSGVGLYGVTFFLSLLYQAVMGVTATTSGTLLMPMLVAMAASSPLSGQILARVKYYRFVATGGLLLMAMSSAMLAQTQPGMPPGRVTMEIVLFGLGMGITWPISTAVIQATAPEELMGVATSQVNFWRSLGGTAGAVALGAIFSHQTEKLLPMKIGELGLPDRLSVLFTGSGGKGIAAILNPARLSVVRHKLPASMVQDFDHAVVGARSALASAMSEVFLLTCVLLAVPIVASLFLRETELKGTGGNR